MSPPAPRRVVVATHNPGKERELAALVRAWGLECLWADQAGLAEFPELGASFEEVARGKASAAATRSGEWALADDSGIVVPTHPEAWGVETRRWAGARGGYDAAVRESVSRGDGRRVAARYVCALALASPAGPEYVAAGVREGELVWPGRGEGPGVWPYFELGSGRTLAELDERTLRGAHPRREAADRLSEELSHLTHGARFGN